MPKQQAIKDMDVKLHALISALTFETRC